MLVLLAALAACWLIGQGQAATPATVRDIPLPEWVSSARCSAEDGRANISVPVGRTLPVDCSETDTMLRCDFDGGEPLDVPLRVLCALPKVPAVPAQTAVVRSARPSRVTVEWLSFSGRLESAVTVVARRAVRLEKVTRLAVASGDDRFVSFLRPGASPVTVRSDDLLAPTGWTLPDTTPGGELVLRTATSSVTPIEFRLLGASPNKAAPVRNIVSFRSVTPGTYQIAPTYEGGLHGRPTTLIVRDGQSTFGVLQAEAVGAVHITSDSFLCDRTAELLISRTTGAGAEGGGRSKTSSIQTVLTLPVKRECTQTVAGLEPGDYRVSFLGEHGELAVQPFQIAAQALTTLSMTSERVRVKGHVNLNGRPLARVRISFTPDSDPFAPISTQTDVEGFYDLVLPAPGHFEVSFQRDGFAMLGNDREAIVSAGENSFDWDLQGATLRVTLRGWTHRAPVDIQLMQRSMSKPGKVGDVIRLSPTGSLPAVFTGISYGRYAVQAKEVLPAGVGPAQVAGTTIDVDQSGEADVELELGAPPGIVRVFGDGNQLIGNATVRIAAGGNALNETEPGVFSLGDMAPSSLVVVSAPGFTPVCRLVPTQSPFDVFLVRGVRVRLQFIGGNVPVPAGILKWPGTDCAISLDRFEVGRSSDAAADFVVRNFPADPNVVYIPGAFDPPERHVPITPDSNGVIRITVAPR